MRRSERPSSTRANKGNNLLAEIEAGAHDPKADLPTLLRKCITLGGATGSTRLRDWATKELKGYEADDTLPSYRITRSLLFLDAAVVGGRVTSQQAPLPLIPDVARPSVQGDIHLPQPIAEIVDLVSSARRDNEGSVRLSPPLAQELLALMNHELAKREQQPWGGGMGLPPSQVIERVYWVVSLSFFVAILDTVRTTLVELVTEMRAGTLPGEALPTHDVAEQAVDIAINGNRNRVVINQVAPNGAGAASIANSEPESNARTVMWWIVGIAGIVAAAAAVIALLIA
jgi:hypothetical protein